MAKQQSQALPEQSEESPLATLLTKDRIADRPDLIQMQMENEAIMARCEVKPRDLGKIKQNLAQMLDDFPELAEDAIYCKPVGKDESGEMKYAEGLSIRAAEVLAEAYGYNRVRSDVTPLDDMRVKVEATFTDYQACRIWQDGGVLSRAYKTSKGGTGVIPEDRFYNLICKAEASRRLREVINRSVNAALKAWFENECRKKQAAMLKGEKADEVAKKWKEQFGIGLADLETIVGRPMAMGWTINDLQRLRGVWTAIKEGETTIQQLLSRQETKPSAVPNSGASINDLAKKPEARTEAAPTETTAAPAETKPAPSETKAAKNETADADKVDLLALGQQLDAMVAEWPSPRTGLPKIARWEQDCRMLFQEGRIDQEGLDSCLDYAAQKRDAYKK